MQRLLNSMKRRCPELPTPNITEQDFRSSFATWRETTTTSPSGRHLGHLKSLLHTIPDDDLEWPPSSMKPQQIFHIIYQIAKLCLQHGHVLARWETVHNLLIQKEPGNQKIHRLRTIHIQECDWQALLRIQVAHKTLPHASAHDVIHPDQWGGVPGRTAIDPAIQAVQEMDYSRMTLQSVAIKFNNAKSCYDRLIEPQTNISL